MLNFDMLAVGTELPFVGTDPLSALATQVADSLRIPGRASAEPPGVGSDHASFIQLGIPAILFNCFCDPHYHTAKDRIEFVQPERLTQAGEIGLEMVAALVP
jgi:Zn-dependent M28 family amino/carboxypeptidase